MRARQFLYIEFLVVLAVVAATALALRPAHAKLAALLHETEQSLLEKVEHAAGKKIYYQSAGFSVFNTFDIRGVELRAAADSAATDGAADSGGAAERLPDIAVERVRVAYSLAALLAGDGLKTIRRVTLDRPRVLVTHRADADTAAPAFGYSRYTFFAGFFGEEFELVVRDGSVSVTAGALAVEADGIHALLKKDRLITLEGRLRGGVRGRQYSREV